MEYQCTQERFLKDVVAHQMQIIRDDEVYRHLRFKRPNETAYYFDLITWPSHLCCTGDMGTFVFSRLNDMFGFFRSDGYRVNPKYWAGKLLADNLGQGHEEFDEDNFRRVINEYRISWMRKMREAGLSRDDRREIWDAVECQVIGEIDNGKERAQIAAYDFHNRIDCHEFYFQDLWENNFKQFTFDFIWCCYALVWDIEQYDKANLFQEAVA